MKREPSTPDAPSDSSAGLLSRREFFALSGAGLFVLWGADALAAAEPKHLPARSWYPTDFNAYMHIAPDGRVACMVGKVELGQGSKTALAQLLAEELDVSFDSIDMLMGDTDRCPWDMGTFGSLTIRVFGPVLRAAAAEARAVLLAMAAEHLHVPAGTLRVRDGVVSDPRSPGRRVTYAQLVQGKRIERHLDEIPVKDPSAFSVIGTSPRRKDALDKVTGRAKYAADLAPKGTLHARILRPPAHGATLRSVDTSAAEKMAGVRVVRDGDLVAVLHERPDAADDALARVKAKFGLPRPGTDNETIFDHLLAAAPSPELVDKAGDVAKGEKQAATIIDRTYYNSYVAHAPIETHSALAEVEGGKVTVWASTQAPFIVKRQVAEALGVAPRAVRVITPYVGGGFGGKSSGPQAVEAARLAKLTGKPVQVVWSREEEFFNDTFRPAAVVKIRAGLTSAGRIPSWDFAVYCAGDREAKQFYDIPNQRTVSSGGWSGNTPGLHPFGIGPWRGPSVNTNTFARESHIDILAHEAGLDPLEFRLRHLSDPRMRRVLQAAAEKFGWSAARAPSGRGVGVACAIYIGTYVATMAEVEVDRRTGGVQTKRVVCALDEGVVVDPEGSRQQIEGSITMGLGYALTEEIRFKNGAIFDGNFDSYEIPRFSWVPRIETVLIDNPVAATGCGEPPIVTMGAVIANAVYDATGARLFQLPMTKQRVMAALPKLSAP